MTYTQSDLQQIKLLYPNSKIYVYSLKFDDTDNIESVLEVIRKNRPEHIEIQFGTDRVYFIYITYKESMLDYDSADCNIDTVLRLNKVTYDNTLMNTRIACFLVKLMKDSRSTVFDNLTKLSEGD